MKHTMSCKKCAIVAVIKQIAAINLDGTRYLEHRIAVSIKRIVTKSHK